MLFMLFMLLDENFYNYFLINNC